jgi:hypothetical protein
MKTIKLFLLSTLLGFSTLVSAQDYAFKVLANKGNNEVKSGAAWQPLKTGATLRSDDEVKLGNNGYVGLVHQSGKPLEVKETGVYKVSVLEGKLGAASSVLNKYTDFILSSNASDGKKTNLTATGAVHRAITNNGPIRVQLPEKDHSGIFNKTAIINWAADDIAGPYVVTLRNMFEDVLTQVETEERSVQIDLSEQKYANETAILVEVSSKANPKVVSQQHLIKKLSPAELDKVAKAVSEIRQEVTDKTAMDQLILASFYEQNSLLIDAIYAYEQAVKLAPEVTDFRQSYDDFLVRNNLK